MTKGAGADDRRRRHRSGHFAEYVAAAYLTARGHRVLARRFRTRCGEIDLIVLKRGRVGFVEVKRRPTRLECEAAITSSVSRRVRNAADIWLARFEDFQSHQIGFDLVFVTPWRFPEYLPDAL